MNDTTPQAPSVWSRRIKYGLNVAVLVLAALAIVIFANWITVRNITKWGNWTRIDLTATRQYSLSPQTRQVLNHLDRDVDITTLFLTGSDMSLETAEKIRYFRDLLDEYQRWGDGRVTVSHLQPAADIDKFRKLCAQITDRYKTQLIPAQNALTETRKTLRQISAFGKQQSLLFTQKMPLLQSNADPQLGKLLQQITQVLSSLDDQLQLADLSAAIDKISDSPLPDYAGLKARAAEPLRQFRDNLLSLAIKALDQRIASGDTHPDVKDFLTGARNAFNQILAPVTQTLDTLDAVNTTEYDVLRSSIMRANSSIIMTPDRITVIKLDDVYTDEIDTSENNRSRHQPEQRFRGEEALTSAIISITLKTKPLVVFVNSAQQSAVGPGGPFSFVASQLRNMNFEVREWNPAGRRTQLGPTPPEPKPQPEKDQPIVWVFLPQSPPDPRMPFMPPNTQTAETLKNAIKDHQPAFVILAPNPMSRFGQPDAIADTLSELGITVDSSIQVMQNLIDPNTGRPTPTMQMTLTTWPKDHPVGKALAGQIGILLSSMPLTLTPKDDAKAWPLIQTPADTWGETDLTSRQPKKDAAENAGPFTVAAAFADKNERIVVLTDPYFATDQVTQYGPRDPFSGRLLHTLFPGNGELFTDSIYWLAGQDNLIATSARSQDIRRYDAISATGHIAVGWIVLLGLPVLCLAAGAAVWFIRRK
ncbi:MAG: Gldg family protein [Phycisphaeraceae bacterium]